MSSAKLSGPLRPRFHDELLDFWRFIKRPSLAPRSPKQMRGDAWTADWQVSVPFKRLLQWAALLWVTNLLVFGPVAVAAAGLGGSEHRLNVYNIPWLTGLIWAPVVEELAFRYGLRRPVHIAWFTPLALVAVLFGWHAWTAGVVLLILVLAWGAARRWPAPVAARSGLHRTYSRHFGWIFYVSAIGFAAMHLYNFRLGDTPLWLMPALVLPQFFTGLVLGWLRVRQGIGTAIVLHTMFNAGPLLMVALLIGLVPEGMAPF